MDNKVDRWIGDYYSGSLTPSDAEELKKWLGQSDENRRVFARAVEALDSYRGYTLARQSRASAYRNMEQQITMSARKRRLWIPMAAAVALLLVGSTLYFTLRSGEQASSSFAGYSIEPGSVKALLTLSDGTGIELTPQLQQEVVDRQVNLAISHRKGLLRYDSIPHLTEEPPMHTIEVPLGGEYHFILPDGTRVWLNAGSRLTFPIRFTGPERRVFMEGELFFEVAYNRESPFIVVADETTVQVLGTHFSVSAYPGKTLLTTLELGAVRVNYRSESLELAPGMQAVVKNETGTFYQRAVETSLYTSWVRGIFEYENMSLETITEQLSRWYDVQFSFSAPELSQRYFTGIVVKYKNLEESLEMIEKTTNVKFIMNENRTIYVTKLPEK